MEDLKKITEINIGIGSKVGIAKYNNNNKVKMQCCLEPKLRDLDDRKNSIVLCNITVVFPTLEDRGLGEMGKVKCPNP